MFNARLQPSASGLLKESTNLPEAKPFDYLTIQILSLAQETEGA